MTRLQAGRSLHNLDVIAWLFSFSFINYFDRTIMAIAGPEIMNQTGIAPTEMGIVYSAFTIGYALFMVPGGRLVDRRRPELIIAVSIVSGAILTFLTAMLGIVPIRSHLAVMCLVLIIRFVFGAVTAPLYPACSKITTLQIAPHYHGRAQGIIIAGAPLGGAVSPLLFSAMTSRYSWPVSFCLAAVGTGILGVCWLFRPGSLYTSSSSAATASVRLAVQSPPARVLSRNLLLLTTAYFMLGYFQGIFFYWIYYYLGFVRRTGVSEAARYTAILFVTMAIMAPVGGWLSDRLTGAYGARFGRRAVPITGLLFASVFLYVGLAVSSLSIPIGVIFFSLAIGFAAFCEGPSWAAVMELSGDTVGTSGSILNTGGMLGGILSPIVTPLIGARFGWTAALLMGSCAAIVGIVAWLQFDPSPDSSGPRRFSIAPSS
jgi:MFS family permease